jgi:hypothetical protein
VTRTSGPILSAVIIISALLLLGADAAANIHGVATIRVFAADEPPEYDLGQFEEEVTRGIRRTKRNYWLRAGLLGSAAGGSTGNECGSGGAYYAVIQLACEVATEVASTAEDAARRAQADQALNDLARNQGKSDPELSPELSANIDEVLSTNLLQLQLATAVREFILKNTDVEVVSDEPDADPGHRITTRLVRVEAIGNYLDSQVAIRLRGEAVLASHSDGAILDRYSYDVVTPKQFIEAWSGGGAGLVAELIDDGIMKMAEVLAEEVLLVVASPHRRGKGYLVVPTAPKYKNTLMGATFDSIGGEYRPTKTLQPTFAWKDFRDAYAEDPLYADVAASDIDVSYDLRIYRARPISPSAKFMLSPAELVHEFRGIPAEEFTPDVAFAPCTPYAWTVRARFVGRNKTHLTYWSGTYKEKHIDAMRERRVSDETGDRLGRVVFSTAFVFDQRELQREEAHYFPFLATPKGQKCSKGEVLAAMAE